jgi:hypothetical protein
MRKVYILNRKQNNASIILTGNTGNRVRFEFKGGSVFQNIMPSFITDNQYEQELLEKSAYYHNGLIKLSQIIPDGTSKNVVDNKLIPVAEVTRPSEAILWVADNLQVKATSGIRALEAARKRGYNFPNLKA